MIILNYGLVAIVGLLWGSFLNVVALDLLAERSLLVVRRSQCSSCTTQLPWHDLIPIVSYLLLRGKCRFCKCSVSILYACIEVLTACIGLLIVHCNDSQYWLGYAVISSALIVTIRTDLESYDVSSWMTLYMIPLVLLMSFTHFIDINCVQSGIGALSAYLFLYTVRAFFWWYKGFEGLGLGDVELLAFVGSFLGPEGWWMTLLIACCTGSIVGVVFILVADKDHNRTPIAFCPFIAAGAWVYLFFAKYYSYASIIG